MNVNARRARKKFLSVFPDGFQDEKYLAWERDYKWLAHQQWEDSLGRFKFEALLNRRNWKEIAGQAVRIESKTNLLFSFEKMALRDALRSGPGAKTFSTGLYEYLYGQEDRRARFEEWIKCVSGLPRRQTRVLTWPVLTVFPFIAAPRNEIFLKPLTTKNAAALYGVDFRYDSTPTWDTYASLLKFAESIRQDNADLRPRDLMDIQSFIWVLGSSEYQ